VIVRESPPARSLAWTTGVTLVTTGGAPALTELYVTMTFARLMPPSGFVTTNAKPLATALFGAVQVIDVAVIDDQGHEIEDPPTVTEDDCDNAV